LKLLVTAPLATRITVYPDYPPVLWIKRSGKRTVEYGPYGPFDKIPLHIIDRPLVPAEVRLAGYRFFLLTKDGKINSSVDIACANDTEAMAHASDLLQTAEEFPIVEVWSGQRLVGRLPPH
jgi:hypothetical protein